MSAFADLRAPPQDEADFYLHDAAAALRAMAEEPLLSPAVTPYAAAADLTAFACMKASRSALIRSLWVVHMPWGAPL
jgi:hypothetical protein